MPLQPAFSSSLPLHRRRPGQHIAHNVPHCSAQPPQLPDGATLHPSANDSPIQRRIRSLRFGYELPTLPPSACSVRYRCAHGHIVRTRPNSPACKFCPTCILETFDGSTRRGRKLTLCQAAALAHDRGGRLLSSRYVSARDPLVWRCAEGHVWKAPVNNIRSAKSWCPECARQKKKLTLHDMQQMAQARGGECLSDKYISEHVKLLWRCREGHQFWLAPNNIRRKPNGTRKPSWCSTCRKKERAAARAKSAAGVAS